MVAGDTCSSSCSFIARALLSNSSLRYSGNHLGYLLALEIGKDNFKKYKEKQKS